MSIEHTLETIGRCAIRIIRVKYIFIFRILLICGNCGPIRNEFIIVLIHKFRYLTESISYSMNDFENILYAAYYLLGPSNI